LQGWWQWPPCVAASCFGLDRKSAEWKIATLLEAKTLIVSTLPSPNLTSLNHMPDENSLGLFDAYGIELEYMIVDRNSLDVQPISDQALTAAAGELTGEAEFGSISWSNELALHVLEIKVSEPVNDLQQVVSDFQQNVQHANSILAHFDACLMPTAMHPWMNPYREMKLWPHDYNPVYEAFNRIFNCRGHGWSNLQSTHWNLPFRNQQEFAKLHAAIRLVLPLLPALAASSPIYDGRTHGVLDCRLEVYRHNSAKIPSITGAVIPEPVYSEADYEREIYQRMYRDIAPEDPDGVLQHIWLNARGAIARFDRGAIEIRVLDIQECPQADIAIGSLVVAVLQALCSEKWTAGSEQAETPTDQLAQLLRAAIRRGPQAVVPPGLARHFGHDGSSALNVGELWQSLLSRLQPHVLLTPAVTRNLELIFQQGTLSQRILNSLGGDLSPAALHRTYQRLCECLQHGTMFSR
jgi:glutamate---cysteine ligase / carboxylate-amine ligase